MPDLALKAPAGAGSQLPALSGVQAPEWSSAKDSPRSERPWLPSLAGVATSVRRLQDGHAEAGQDLQPRLGTAGLSGHSPLCRALPVSRRRWVLLVRVALGGFLVESCARRGRFLLTFFRLWACSEAVREEIR